MNLTNGQIHRHHVSDKHHYYEDDYTFFWSAVYIRNRLLVINSSGSFKVASEMSHASEMANMDGFKGVFDRSFVVALKGRTNRVSKKQCQDAIKDLETTAQCITQGGYCDHLVIVWDGDDIEEGSFTEVLQALVQMLTTLDASLGVNTLRQLRAEGKIFFVYAMATTSPYGVNHAPRGIDTLITTFGADHVYSLISGKQSGQVADMLTKEIINLNVMINHSASSPVSHLTSHEFVVWVEEYIKPLFGDGTDTWVLDGNSGRFEKDKYGAYGYLLLGIAFARLTNPLKIIYVGMGLVSIAEREYHCLAELCHQIKIS